MEIRKRGPKRTEGFTDIMSSPAPRQLSANGSDKSAPFSGMAVVLSLPFGRRALAAVGRDEPRPSRCPPADTMPTLQSKTQLHKVGSRILSGQMRLLQRSYGSLSLVWLGALGAQDLLSRSLRIRIPR